MKRSIKINFDDGSSKDLNITKVTAVKLGTGFIHFDRIGDDEWGLFMIRQSSQIGQKLLI